MYQERVPRVPRPISYSTKFDSLCLDRARVSARKSTFPSDYNFCMSLTIAEKRIDHGQLLRQQKAKRFLNF